MDYQKKSLGFRLFGNVVRMPESDNFNIDLDSHYEIQFVPGQDPSARVVEVKRIEEKHLDVELPAELQQSTFEKICTFLLEKNLQLIVKETGFEKLRNRKLVLDVVNPSKNQLVNVIIFIQGKYNNIDYEVELNPYDISLSYGEIKNQKCQVVLEDFRNVAIPDIKKVFPKLKPTNFELEFKENQIIFRSTSPLKQFIHSIGKPTKYQNINTHPVKKEGIYTIMMPQEPDAIETVATPKHGDSTTYQSEEKKHPVFLAPEKILPSPQQTSSATEKSSCSKEKPQGLLSNIWTFFSSKIFPK